MGRPFGVFAREYILTWDHVQAPYSFAWGDKDLALKSEQRASSIAFTVIFCRICSRCKCCLSNIIKPIHSSCDCRGSGYCRGDSLYNVLCGHRIFQVVLTQPPADARRRPPPEDGREPRRADPRLPSRAARHPEPAPAARATGFAHPGSPHTKENFRQKPDWLVQRSSDPSFVGAATSLRQENERKYFASLWKSIYEGKLAAVSHWTNFSDQDDMLKSNTFEVEEGAPWYDFARFAQVHIQ